jgi:RNA polymerase sigma factor (sigma-70 family)
MKATTTFDSDRPTNAQLMERFYSGDMDAFGQLAERLRPGLMSLALRRLPSRHVGRIQVAEDMVQQTLIKAVGTLERPEIRWQQSKGAVSTWMGTILRNAVISYLRTRASKTPVSSDLWCGPAGEDSRRPESDIVDHRLSAERNARQMESQRHRWRLVIGKLPKDTRSIFHLKMQGKSHQEIADRLGVARSTITYRIKTATATLRSMAAA